jgi:RNA polymerase sigma factor (sigma-70 family)
VSPELLESLFEKVRSGDFQAAEQVFVNYEAQLRVIVRRQLSRRLRVKFDSLDVVQSVWRRVLQDFRTNGCKIVSAEHLRNFLIQVTRNCLTDRLRHFRPALAREQSVAHAVDTPAVAQPRPSEIAQGKELWETLLANCPAKYHELLRLKRQGLTIDAIAAQTGMHEGSIRRIIRQLARKMAFPSDVMGGTP